jgi:drug/metabolite transporter (DMT)-like permease
MKYIPVLFGLAMALVDVFVLGALRAKHEQPEKISKWVLPVAFVVYGLQSLVFYKSLDYSSLVVMNMLWDVASDILVSLVGFLFFKEVLTKSQIAGVLFGIISIFLLSR